MPDLSKVPPWAWVIGAVGIGAALYLYKKHKEQMELAASETTSEATTEQTVPEAPVEQYPYSYAGEGGGGGASGAIGSAGEQPFTELFGTILQSEREMSQQQSEQQRSFLESILESNRAAQEAAKGGSTVTSGSGGGAPSSGTGTVTPPITQAQPKCPGAFPKLNGSAASPHTCYKDTSKSMTGPKGAKATCQCHTYQDGHNECQHVVNGKCSW